MKPIAIVVSIAAITVLSFALPSRAEEKHGVQIYPGARYDEAASKNLKQMMNQQDTSAYRTDDTLEKVAAFYKEQPGIAVVLEKPEWASFTRNSQVGITLQRPWRDSKDGPPHTDTLIMIVK